MCLTYKIDFLSNSSFVFFLLIMESQIYFYLPLNYFFKGYDDRRPHRDHSWEGRSGSLDRERNYMQPHKDWDNDDYRAAGDWGRERHWPLHDPQVQEHY